MSVYRIVFPSGEIRGFVYASAPGTPPTFFRALTLVARLNCLRVLLHQNPVAATRTCWTGPIVPFTKATKCPSSLIAASNPPVGPALPTETKTVRGVQPGTLPVEELQVSRTNT